MTDDHHSTIADILTAAGLRPVRVDHGKRWRVIFFPALDDPSGLALMIQQGLRAQGIEARNSVRVALRNGMGTARFAAAGGRPNRSLFLFPGRGADRWEGAYDD